MDTLEVWIPPYNLFEQIRGKTNGVGWKNNGNMIGHEWD